MPAEEGQMPFAKCASHRARDRLFAALYGRKPQAYWSVRRSTAYGVYQLTEEEMTRIKGRVKGITFLRGDTSDLMRCWTHFGAG